MPRIRYTEDREETPESRALIESASRTGAPHYRASKLFSPQEKAALRYAEIFKTDAADTDWDQVYTELKRHVTDAEIIELGQLCAQTDGMRKLRQVAEHHQLGRGVRAEADAQGRRAWATMRLAPFNG